MNRNALLTSIIHIHRIILYNDISASFIIAICKQWFWRLCDLRLNML